MSSDDGCVALCCGAICVALSSALQQWCNLKTYGADGCCCCGSSRGCCPNLGSFDDDEWDKENERQKAKEAEAVATQPTASPGMQAGATGTTTQGTA